MVKIQHSSPVSSDSTIYIQCSEWHLEKELCKGCQYGCCYWEESCKGKSCETCEYIDGWFK